MALPALAWLASRLLLPASPWSQSGETDDDITSR